MPVTLIGSVGAATSSTNAVTGSYGQATTAGHLLVAAITWFDGTLATWNPTATAGWRRLISGAVGNNNAGTSHAGVDVWYLVAAGGDGAPTFTNTGGGTQGMTCAIFELAGANSNSPLDTSGSYQSGSASLGAPPVMTPVTAGTIGTAAEFAISAFVQDNQASVTQTWTELGTGWTQAQATGSTTQFGHSVVNYQAAPSPGATLSDSGEFSSGTTVYAAAVVVAIAAAYDAPVSALVSPSFRYAFRPGRAVEFDGPYAPWTLTMNAEGGTGGVIVTNANSGSSGNPVGLLNQAGFTTYSVTNPAHGNLCYVFTYVGSAVNTAMQWGPSINNALFPSGAKGAFPPSGATLYFRHYLYLPYLPNFATNFMRFAPHSADASLSFQVHMTVANQFQLTYNNNANIAFTAPQAAPVGTWLRLEGWTTIGIGNAQCQLSVYEYDSLTPIWPTQTSTATFTLPVPMGIYHGLLASNTAGFQCAMDDIAVGTTGLFGPAGTSVTIQDAPQAAQVGPAWVNAFQPWQRRQVQGYGDAQSVTLTAAATAALTLAGSAAGTRSESGSVTGALALAASAAGTREESGSVTGALALAATASGTRSESGSGTGALALTASASGSRQQSASVTGSLVLSAIAAGFKRVVAAVSGLLGLSATATGVMIPPPPGGATITPAGPLATITVIDGAGPLAAAAAMDGAGPLAAGVTAGAPPGFAPGTIGGYTAFYTAVYEPLAPRPQAATVTITPG